MRKSLSAIKIHTVKFGIVCNNYVLPLVLIP